MKNREIGTTGIQVNEIGYGAMHLSIDKDRRPTEAHSIDLLKRAVDELGVDFIDTADAYCNDQTEVGHNERLIAQALRGERRQRVTIATKGGSIRPDGRWERDGSPRHLREACEASLRALETDRIDLYQLHAPDPRVPVEDSIGTLADLQREGKIRHIGVSNFDVDQLERAMREASFVSVQNRFSIVAKNEQEDAVIAWCEEHALSYLPWNPVGGRGLAPRLASAMDALDDIAAAHKVSAQTIALAWLLARSPRIMPIPGTTKVEHLAENMRAAEIELTDEEKARLRGEEMRSA